MQAGAPDRDTPAPSVTLAGRLARVRLAEGRWWVPAILAGLIAAGPVATIVGASILTDRARAATARLQAESGPRIAAERSAMQARAQFGNAIALPTIAATLDALAPALPGDASVVRAERTRGGALELDIATTDPDRLRAAIRRAPGFGRMRDASQRQTDAAMIVSLREAGE